jgi:hypothetical protein
LKAALSHQSALPAKDRPTLNQLPQLLGGYYSSCAPNCAPRFSELELLPMDDTVQIRCTRCKGSFRDRARRLQSGYSRQCPNCDTVIFFEEGSVDKNVQRALQQAKNLRRALREGQTVTGTRTSTPFIFRR